MKIKDKYSPILLLSLAVIITSAVIVLSIKHLLPLVLGILISILIDPVVSYIERKLDFDRGVITAVVLAAIFCLVGYISLLIVGRFTFELARFIHFLPTQMNKINALIDKFYPYLLNFFAKIPEDVLAYLKANLNQILYTITGSLIISILIWSTKLVWFRICL